MFLCYWKKTNTVYNISLLQQIVETRILIPFLGIHNIIRAGASGPGGAEFAEFKKETEEKHSVAFHTSLDSLPSVADGVKRLALISGRTVDNPRLLEEAIKVSFITIKSYAF